MTEDNSQDGLNAVQPKKKRLDISVVLKPMAEIDTTIGKVFLFPLRLCDIIELAKLPDQPSTVRIRSYLPRIASLSAENSLDQKRIAITPEQVDKLSDDEVEALAEVYASSNLFLGGREGTKDRAAIVRESNEVSSTYLDRLLRDVIDEQAKRSRKIMESVLGSTQGIFDQVRKSSLELGDSWRQLERLTKASAISRVGTPAIKTGSLEFSNHMAEHGARMARERAEDREMLRLTAETSTKSAKTLQELADAASTMLEKLDQRDADAKRTTKIQLWIAVGSVVVSALLAGASFFQDRSNNESGDKWQAEMLDEVRLLSKRGEMLEAQNK